MGGGMFGGGNDKWKNALMAAAAGFMARRSPGVAGSMLNNLQDAQTLKQRMAFEEQQYQRHRQDNNADFQAHRQYEIDNPLPQQPGEFEQTLIASGIQPGTPQWTQAMVTRRQNMLDPPVMTPQGMMLRSQVVAGSATPAPAGVTFTPLPAQGGPTPQASGGFPGY